MLRKPGALGLRILCQTQKKGPMSPEIYTPIAMPPHIMPVSPALSKLLPESHFVSIPLAKASSMAECRFRTEGRCRLEY